MIELACFITSHGFGHATRMTAVLEALQRTIPNLHPHIFTTVPRSLFSETLQHFSYHHLLCDIGLIQKDGLREDIPATIKVLQDFLPFDPVFLDGLAHKIQGCKLVLCDISALGIAVAQIAGIPSVLIENFTWDWIYRAYLHDNPGLSFAIEYLGAQYRRVGTHIRCQPSCGTVRGDFECSPISRRIHTGRIKVRKQLRCENKPLVLISMGGTDVELPFIEQLINSTEAFFILTGQKTTHRLKDNVLLLERESDFYHPDLINSAELVICKSGYSTLAECSQAAVSVVTVGRTHFAESKILEIYSRTKLKGQTLGQEEFLSGSWIKNLKNLCLPPRQKAKKALNGSSEVAHYLQKLLAKC